MVRKILFYVDALYSERIHHMVLINLLIVTILCTISSDYFVLKYIQIEQADVFTVDYLYQNVLFIKLNIILVGIVLVHRMKTVLPVLFLESINKKRYGVMMLYLFCGMGVIGLFSLTSGVICLLTGTFLTEYFIYEYSLVLLLRLVMFGMGYYVVLSFVYLWIPQIYGLLSVFIVYFMVIMSTGYVVEVTEFSLFVKIMHMGVSDLVLYSDLRYSFLYGDFYQIAWILLFYFALLWRFNRIDFL